MMIVRYVYHNHYDTCTCMYLIMEIRNGRSFIQEPPTGDRPEVKLLNKLGTHGACLNHVRNYVRVNYGYYAVLTYTTYQISSVWDYTRIGENLVLAK